GQEGAAGDWWAGRTLIAPPPAAAPAPLPMPPVQRFTLKNGLTVIAVESSDAPTVQVQLAVKGGRQSEPPGKVGLSNFVASMLTRGARGKSEAQLTAALEQVGAQLSSNASYETLVISCHAPAAGRATCVDTVAAMAIAPSFPAGAMAEVRNQLTTAARQSRMDPTQLTNLQFQNALWGEENGRGWAMSEKSIGAIQRADLVAWHKAQFSARNAVLLVVGPPPAQVKPAVERAFGGWQGGAVRQAAPPPVPQLRGLKIRLVDVPGLNQAHVRVGRTGIAHRDPDFAAASVVNHVLGGGDSSRISRAVRKAFAGRAAASSSFDRNLDVGAFVAAGVAPTPEAVALMRVLIDQITAMAADGPGAGEVKAAIAELAGGYQTRLESTGEVGSALMAAELHGFDAAYVRDFGVTLGRVTAGAARSSAARWLDGKNLVVVLTGNAQAIEPQLMEAGLKYDRVAADLGGGGAGKVAEPARPASPKAEAAARAVLEAALAAKGGADKLAAVKSLSWKGKATLNLPNGKVPAQVEKRFVAPDKLRLDMVIEMGGAKMSITTALAGDIGWAQERRPDGSRTIDFPASEVEAGKAQIWRDQDFVLLRHREKGATVAPLDDVDLDGVKHHAIRVTAADGKTVVLLVDKKNKRLGGMTYEEQGVSAEERFGNYKAVNGVQVAQSRRTKSAQVDLDTQVTDIQINPPIDAGIYKKPADATPPGKKPPPPARKPPPSGGKPAPGK
ncbi:MAG TPA: pitrilysin family protein, partial [Kofleriaceae bacterium]|nr:pitrilysin family protein [Kofleriaceae bacterium]